MRVRFYIEKRKGGDGKLLTIRRPIFMTVAFHGRRVLISTGRHIDLKWWDVGSQQVKEVYPDAVSINSWLQTLLHTAGVVWKALASLSEKPGAEDFRKEFERLRPRFSGGFFDVMIMFMEEGSARWSKNSYRKVRTFYNQIREFSTESGYPVQFNTINESFLQQFKAYQQQKGRSAVTILKMVNTLVWFLNWATERGYNIFHDYRGFYKMLDTKSERSKVIPVYLEWGELMVLLNTVISETRKERARDVFCFMCFTGLKFSELGNLKKEDIGLSLLTVRKSAGPERQLPLNDYAKGILLKYENRYYRDNYALPPVSPVTANKYLKILGRELKFNRMVPDPKDGSKLKPVWEVLTAGAGVQTFIMNAIRLEIPADIISTFTGVANDQRIKILMHEMATKQIRKFNEI